MRRLLQVPLPGISRSNTEKEGMSTIAAFMLAILPVLDVVTKVTLGIARPARTNRRNRPILRAAMILFFQLLNLGATPKATSEASDPGCGTKLPQRKRPVRGTRCSTGSRGIYPL